MAKGVIKSTALLQLLPVHSILISALGFNWCENLSKANQRGHIHSPLENLL